MLKEPGQESFETYNNAGANPGKDWRGGPVPEWKNLTDDVRIKWAAVEARANNALFATFGNVALGESLPDETPEAFARAWQRYQNEGFANNAPLPVYVLLDCFDSELRKLAR